MVYQMGTCCVYIVFIAKNLHSVSIPTNFQFVLCFDIVTLLVKTL